MHGFTDILLRLGRLFRLVAGARAVPAGRGAAGDDAAAAQRHADLTAANMNHKEDDMKNSNAIDTMARTIWGEARGEGAQGMRAVACTVVNRVKAPGWWGRDVESVCLKPFQYTCWNTNDPNREKLLAVTEDDGQFALAKLIAEQAVKGGLTDITKGATHYYKKGTTTPFWARGMQPCAEIGRHLFFNNIS